MFRVHKDGEFWRNGYFHRYGRVFMRRCDLINSIKHHRYSAIKDADGNWLNSIEVWVYAKDGLSVDQYPIAKFMSTKPAHKFTPFRVDFYKNRMVHRHYTWHTYDPTQTESIVYTGEPFNKTMQLDETVNVRSGTAAWFKGDDGLYYYANPRGFSKMVNQLILGRIDGRFRFVNHGGVIGVEYVDE